MYYPCSENKGADQLHGFLCFRICADCWFSHAVAQVRVEGPTIDTLKFEDNPKTPGRK